MYLVKAIDSSFSLRPRETILSHSFPPQLPLRTTAFHRVETHRMQVVGATSGEGRRAGRVKAAPPAQEQRRSGRSVDIG